jgi:hypothetical protein
MILSAEERFLLRILRRGMQEQVSHDGVVRKMYHELAWNLGFGAVHLKGSLGTCPLLKELYVTRTTFPPFTLRPPFRTPQHALRLVLGAANEDGACLWIRGPQSITHNNTPNTPQQARRRRRLQDAYLDSQLHKPFLP